MIEGYKALNDNIDPGPLGLWHAVTMHKEFFVSRDYDWWGLVKKDDVVVDVGACVGFFSCTALDYGASKVYMLEPNKELLKVCIKNTMEYVIDAPVSPVVPIHAAIGDDESHTKHVFNVEGVDNSFPTISFSDFISKYQIDHIDYLKLDCEGGEYSILTPENLDWISKNVGHIAMEVHLRADGDSTEKFIQMRDNFLAHFVKQGKVKFQSADMISRIFDDKAILNKDYSKVPAEFMIYILNKD